MEKGLYQDIGELLYYDTLSFTQAGSKEDKKTLKTFEQLPIEDQKDWYTKGTQCLIVIEKLNMVIIRKDQEETFEKRQKNLNILTEIIEKFVGKLKKLSPKPFPSSELAHWIYGGRLK